MKRRYVYSAAACALAAMSPTLAAPGDLDPTFGNAGRVIFDDTSDDNWPAGGALLPDGRIIVGRGNSNATDDFSVLRFHADGSPDSSFDHDGRTSLDIPGIKGETHSVFLQPDGRVIVLGWIREGNLALRLGLARYLEDGSLDTSFGNNGWVRSEASFEGLSLSALLQPDGRLVIAGSAYQTGWSGRRLALARFDPDGSLDHSFGQNGYAYTEGSTYEWLSQLARQPDGKLLLFMDVEAMSPKAWYDWRATIMRFEPDGLPDQTFGLGGRAPLLNETSFSSGLVLADGRILAALANEPYDWDISYCGAVLTRVQPDGRPDVSFGTDGVSQQRFGGCQTFGPSMLIDPQGAILVNGHRSTSESGALVIDSSDHVVTRLNSAGELDRSFGREGQAVLDVGDGEYLPYVRWGGSLLRQDDGKLVILASGFRALISSGPNTRLVLARLQRSGGSPGLVGIKAVEATVAESDGHIDVRVRRSGGSEGLVSVDYSTTSGSASSNADFIPVAGTLTWADGDREDNTITVEIVSDTVNESREQFTLMLSNVAGGAGLATSRIPISIDRPVGEVPTPPPVANSRGGGGALSWDFLLTLALGILALNGGSRRRLLRACSLPALPSPATAPDQKSDDQRQPRDEQENPEKETQVEVLRQRRRGCAADVMLEVRHAGGGNTLVAESGSACDRAWPFISRTTTMTSPYLDWIRAASISAAALVVGSCSSLREPPSDLQAVYARAIPGFGGLFIDDNGVPTVYLTDLGQQAVAQQALVVELRERGFVPDQLRFVQSAFDYLQLDRWFKQAGQPVFENPEVVFLDLDEARNRVVVGVKKEEERARVESTLVGLGIPAAAIVVEYTEPAISLVSLVNLITPVPGGVWISRATVFGDHSCSLGFTADITKTGNTTDHRRSFVTAGHCTEESPGVDGAQFSQGFNTLGVEIDDPPGFSGGACPLFAPVKCRYSDAARILYSGGASSNLAGIARTTHAGHLTGSLELLGTFRITAKRTHPLSGTRVHKVGATTGWTVGKITRTGVFRIGDDGKVIYIGQAVVNAGAQKGDSGAPVFEINPGGKTATLLGVASFAFTSWDKYGFSPMSGIEHDLGTLRVFTSTPSGTRQIADLIPERLHGVAGRPGFCRRNEVNKLIVRVRNQSNHNLPKSTTTRVVFSPTHVVARSTPPLAAGAAADLTFQIPPACSADGSCDFTIGVDADIEVDERHGNEVDQHEINNIETGECFFACPSGKHCCKPGPIGTCGQCLPDNVTCP